MCKMKRGFFLASVVTGVIVASSFWTNSFAGASHIGGTVVEEGSGVLINDAKVTAINVQDSRLVYSCYTNQYGGYSIMLTDSFNDLPGDYHVIAEKQGYESEWWKEGTQKIVTVPAGSGPDNINFTLKKSGSTRGGVAGKVTEEQTGYPIAGALVSIFFDPVSNEIAWTHSDSNGNYEAEFDLRADTEVVYVACTKTGYKGEWWDNKFSPQDADFIVVTNGQTHNGIDFALEQGAINGISGIVCEAGKGVTPINDAKVSVYSSSDTSNRIAEAFSHRDGSYFIPLAPGSYYLRADKQGYESEWYLEGNIQSVGVSMGQVTENINFTLAKDFTQDGAISGIVMSEGGRGDSSTVMPLDAYVELYASQDESTYIDLQKTDQNGFYRFSQLEPGTYYVHISSAYGPYCTSGYVTEWWDDEKLPKNANAIVVTNSEVKGIDFYLVCAGATEVGEVAGVVKDAVTQDPIEGAYVSLVNVSDRLGAYTDYQGKYLIQRVPVGMQSAAASAVGYTPLDSDPFEVKADELTENIDFLLTPDDTNVTYGSISGRVDNLSSNGGPAFVAVFSVDDDRPVATVQTDRQAGYKVEKLLPGKYHVRAQAQGCQEQWFQMMETRDGAYEVEVKAGQDTPGIYFKLNPEQELKGGISGMILDASGVGIADARVHAQGIRNWFEDDTHTDSTGAYIIEGLIPGLYKVRAVASGYESGTYPEPVEVLADAVTEEIDIVLEELSSQAGTISGIVKDDSTSAPIPYTLVMVFTEQIPFIGYAITDQNGCYVVKDVPAAVDGSIFYVLALSREYIPEFYDGVHSWQEATLVSSPADNIDFELGRVPSGIRSICGRITKGKASVENATIYAMNGEEIVGAACSMDDGTYLLTQLPPGTYNLKVSKPGYDDVICGPISVVDQNVSGADAEITVTGVEDDTTPEKQVLQLSVTPSIAKNNVTIYYTLPEKTNAELSVYNVSGRKVVTLVKGRTDSGTHRAILNTSELAQGIYFVRLNGGKAQTIKKLIILQ